MAFNGNSSANFATAATGQTSALQARRDTAIFGALPAFGPTFPGTGFETPPPLAISSNLFKFLKSVGLKSVGLGLENIPFHSGWELIVWEPSLSGLKSEFSEILEICEEIEVEDSIKVFGAQIELNLENPADFGKLPVEVAGVSPTVVVEVEEESSVEVLVSGKKTKGDQAEGTGAVPVPEATELNWVGQAVGTGEHVHEEDRSGEEPDLMEVDPAVRTWDAPVREVMEARTGSEPVLEEVEEETGAMPVWEPGEGDLHFDDYLGDDFEKVGEFTPEETSQTPPTPVPEQPAETPSSAEPRKKRFKTLARRTNLRWVRKLAALKAKPSSSSQQTPPKQPFQPTRKSYRLAAQGVRSSSVNQGPPVIEEILSSSDASPVKSPNPTAEPLESSVLESEHASTENSPTKTPVSQPVLKRKAEAKLSPATKSSAEPSAK